MAGAHLDSVVAGPGLNDNGSGVAAVLEVAEQLASRPLADGAALRVGFWGAEEIGLVGSRRYVRGLSAAERRRIRAYVNLDMVGSPDAKADVYAGEGEAGRRIEAALREGLPDGAGEEHLGGASDHASFAARRASRSAGSSPGSTTATTGPATGSGTWTPRSRRRMRVPPRTRSWRWRRAERRLGGEVGRPAGARFPSSGGLHPSRAHSQSTATRREQANRAAPSPPHPAAVPRPAGRQASGRPISPRNAAAPRASDGDHWVCGRSPTTPSSSMSTFSEKKQSMSRTGSASCSGSG